MSVRQLAAGLLLLVLVPVALYLSAESAVVALSLVSVAIVATSLYYMFSPAERSAH